MTAKIIYWRMNICILYKNNVEQLYNQTDIYRHILRPVTPKAWAHIEVYLTSFTK